MKGLRRLFSQKFLDNFFAWNSKVSPFESTTSLLNILILAWQNPVNIKNAMVSLSQENIVKLVILPQIIIIRWAGGNMKIQKSLLFWTPQSARSIYIKIIAFDVVRFKICILQSVCMCFCVYVCGSLAKLMGVTYSFDCPC